MPSARVVNSRPFSELAMVLRRSSEAANESILSSLRDQEVHNGFHQYVGLS